MGEKLVVGPVNRGLRNDRTAFVIDDDSFPTLINAYQWRGRIKRKRGTSFLCRLQRFFNSTSIVYNPSGGVITFDISGNANLLGGFGLQTNGNIIPGSVTIVGSVGPVTYTDLTKDGYLTPTGTAGPNTIDYATGDILIPAQAGGTATAIFSYYPDLPVMGLEDFFSVSTQFPGTIGFDTTYSYNIITAFPYTSYDVSFYKNPSVSASLPGYVPKTNWTPTTWNGQNYQQFWTTNYQGAMWTTNGINVPFSVTNIGMQFAPALSITYVSNTATTLTVTIAGSPLVIGDFVFVNEWTGTNAITLNFQTGYVTAVAGNITITFPNATIGAGPYTAGIIQYLTNRSSTTKDSLRWYDGDPTNGNLITPGFTNGFGWVNFMPPLSRQIYSIADTPARQYYLVGARMILPFKDRLIFMGPVIQASTGDPIYLQDTVIYSQNGTPYYTASFTGDPSLATTIFNQILVPVNQTATPNAYWEDQTGFGGFVSAGVDQPLITAGQKEDVLIMGFTTIQTRFVSTGNDIVPFEFFLINSELGSGSTFSSIVMNDGVITRGQRGYVITNQVGTQRVDLEIPDLAFQINLLNNGNERFCAQRDFINEWIYFTYNSDQKTYIFPNQTLQYNYRDDSWAQFNESYTTYGSFRKLTGFTWQTVGLVYPTWSVWNDPWDAGVSTLLQPQVIAGNQQGFVLVRENGTGEANSLYIQSFSGNTVTSPNHTLNQGDYIIINGALGTVSNQVNGNIFSVGNVTENTFTLNPNIGTAGTYFGGGLIKRMYVPFIQTKQFPTAWGLGRKTRLGPQQYLFSYTTAGQITLLIFLSQNSSSAYNNLEFPSPVQIVPSNTSLNNSLVYSTTLFTCPETTNLGLTPANINLNLVTSPNQAQIWHRMNTSLLGDTVQIGFTMSDSQMRSEAATLESFAITGASKAFLCVLQCVSTFSVGNEILITGVVGMTQLNGNIYQVVLVTPTQVTINVNTLVGFDTYISGGIATLVGLPNQFAEIEFHGMILDVSPSQLLA